MKVVAFWSLSGRGLKRTRFEDCGVIIFSIEMECFSDDGTIQVVLVVIILQILLKFQMQFFESEFLLFF